MFEALSTWCSVPRPLLVCQASTEDWKERQTVRLAIRPAHSQSEPSVCDRGLGTSFAATLLEKHHQPRCHVFKAWARRAEWGDGGDRQWGALVMSTCTCVMGWLITPGSSSENPSLEKGSSFHGLLQSWRALMSTFKAMVSLVLLKRIGWKKMRPHYQRGIDSGPRALAQNPVWSMREKNTVSFSSKNLDFISKIEMFS